MSARRGAALALATTAALGCVSTTRVVGPRLRYPVSLTEAVLGPRHEVIEASQLERVDAFTFDCNSCQCADRQGRVDVSDAVNEAVASRGGEAVISFRVQAQPVDASPSFFLPSAPFVAAERCLRVEVRGVVVRRRVEALGDVELERLCVDGAVDACDVLARRYVARHDEAAARAVLQTACARRPERCARRAPPPDPARDDAPALALAGRWCRAGSRRACWWAGELLTREGGRLRDDAAGRAMLTTACDGGVPEGCLALAELTVRAGGPPGEALALARRACAAGLARACTTSGRLAGGADARAHFERACALGDAAGCAATAGARGP